jgi:nitrogen fixation protein FixH
MAPAKPQQLDPILFTVQVRNRSGKPISSAIVTVNLAMPTMDMGRNSVVMSAVKPGQYVGTGRFTMAGSWEATVTAAKGKDGGDRVFPVEVQ